MDVKEPVSVLFVCLGNICRSPLAEGLFLHHAEKAGTSAHFRVDSAGTSSEHRGELPDPRTRANAARHGLNLTSRSRQVKVDDFGSFDWILAMDRLNRQDLLHIRPADFKARMHLLLGPELLTVPEEQEVPDPWYGGPEGFERVFQLLHGATERLHDFLCKHHGLYQEARS
jgi:protein-tyrosine phosphatase